MVEPQPMWRSTPAPTAGATRRASSRRRPLSGSSCRSCSSPCAPFTLAPARSAHRVDVFPFFVVFGWLSDRLGRLIIVLAGCLIAVVTFIPLFGMLTHYANPDLEAFQQNNTIAVSADQANCNVHVLVGPWSKFTDCDRAQDFMTKAGLSFAKINAPGLPV